MTSRLSAGCLALALGATACGSPPGAPSTIFATLTSRVGVPVPTAPIHGATVSRTNGGVQLTVKNTVAESSAPIYLTFDFSPSSTFDAQHTTSLTVAQASGDSTSVTFAVSAASGVGSQYYWRARAAAGEDIGQYSARATFDLGLDTGPAPGTPGPPRLVSPAQGAIQNIDAVFTVQPPSESPAVDGYEIQVSPSPSFDRNLSGCAATPIGDTSASCAALLQPGTYFWRAQAVVIPKGAFSLSAGLHGPFSAATSFQVVNESLDIYSLISPASFGAATPNPATITVGNAVRTGTVGSLAYSFSIYAGQSPIRSALVATSTVPEDPSGHTSWTVPFELPINAVYALSVHVIDTTNGATGNDLHGVLAVVSARSVPLTMTVSSPGNTGRCGQVFQVPVFASRDLGTSPVTITNGYNLQMTLGPTMFAPIGGTIQGGDIELFSIAGASTPQARVTGRITGRNTASGSFEGQLWVQTAIDPVRCAASGGLWTLAPR